MGYSSETGHPDGFKPQYIKIFIVITPLFTNVQRLSALANCTACFSGPLWIRKPIGKFGTADANLPYMS